MSKALRIIILICCYYTGVSAQVLPRNGDSLHYRLIGFKVPAQAKATTYTLQVFAYTDDLKTLNDSKPLLEHTDTGNHIIATVPEFGKSYCWRVLYKNRRKLVTTTGYHCFTVRQNPYSDTNISMLHIIDSATAYRDMLVFVDNTKTLYTLNGGPIWFIPDIHGVTDNNYKIRDVKLTNRHTITFLSADLNAYEIDYYGNILWTAPNDGKVSGDKTDYIHHEFTRLSNGHYMIAGNKYLSRKVPVSIPPGTKSDKRMFAIGDENHVVTEAGTLIEYDSTGNVVWSWVSGEHFTNEDLFTLLPDSSICTDTHLNGFYFNEDRKIVYTSFRDISRIVKISYPSGNIIASYGCDYNGLGNVRGNSLFYGQHACRINSNGNLYLFNNNYSKRTYTGKTKQSTVAILKELPDGGIEKIWEFGCNIDKHATAYSARGGNVYELRNRDMLVCMGTAGRFFIVSPEKKLLWNAVLKIKSARSRFITTAYRASPVYADQLHGMLYR